MADVPSSPQPKPPTSARDDALAVLRRLREAGHVAYFAGGCVRDQLLGLEPKDWDVATDAPPDRVRQLFSHTQAVGAAFGVILVKHRKSTIELATFRTDLEYKDGRRPEGVRFTTAEEDAKRRDFTINGLFQDPIEDRIIDYVGGQEDLRNRVLRAIGNPDQRFEEDHLRLLRAVRFAARFGLTIEPGTADAIRAHASQLVRISPERIGDELRRMLTSPTRAVAWALMWDLRLVQQVMRFMPPPHPATLDRERSILSRLAPQRETSFGAALAAAVFCYRWQAEPAFAVPGRSFIVAASKAMRQALKISNEELDEFSGILRDLVILLGDLHPPVATKKRFLAGPTARGTREVLDALVTVPGYDWRYAITLRFELDSLLKQDVAPPPLLNGDDLTAAGLEPGPVFKRVLDQVYDAQLEDRVTDKGQAMELALRLARERPATG